MNPNIRHTDQELFALIKGRPAMYIGEPVNVHTLSTFLGGYKIALFNYRLQSTSAFFSPWPTFHDWVAMKENYLESTSGWANMISGAVSSDAEGMAKFFQYLEEYFARQPITLYEETIASFTAEENQRYPQAIMQIVSYDKSKQGVFLRILDQHQTQIPNIREDLYPTFERAMDDIKAYR